MKPQRIIGKKVTLQDFLPKNYELLFRRDNEACFYPVWRCYESQIPYFLFCDIADFLDLFGVVIPDEVKFAIIETDFVHIKFSEIENIIRISLTFKD